MLDDLNMHHALIATENGYFVSQKWNRLAEMIEDYNPSLELRWIPPNVREIGDGKPYVVVHRQKDGQEYAVLYADELDDPIDVMANIFNADMKHGDVLDRMRNRNTAAQLFELKEKLDEQEARKDWIAWAMKDNKNYKTYRDKEGNLVKLDSELNRVNSRKTIL